MKKQKAKKAGGAKKKDKKEEAEVTEEAPIEAEGPDAPASAEEKIEDAPPEPTDLPTETAEPGSPVTADDDEPTDLPVPKPSHGRKPSVAIESRQRSESFYRSGAGPTSPTGLTPGGGVSSEIYREQVQKIAELEMEKIKLTAEVEEYKTKWEKDEEELEEFREGKGEAAIALEKSKEADKLVRILVSSCAGRSRLTHKQKSEVESLTRQLSQLRTQTEKSTRRASAASPSQTESIDDLNAQIASKSATIESLELEISKVNTQLTEQTNKNNELQSKVSSLESALQKAEQEASSTKTELSDLKASLDKASEQAAKEGSDRDSAQTRIVQVEAELGTANRKASDAISRAELLEKKIETLTQLHRDNDTRNQTRVQESAKIEREAAELRTRVTGLSNENARLREAEQRRRKANLDSIEDSSVQELEDEERDRLMAKVRELEEENFELRRGVWRDRRTAMQPSIDDAGPSQPYTNSGFDEIDLSGAPPARPVGQNHSSFQDVIKSGISAFTGQSQHPAHRRSDAANRGKPRTGSLASLPSLDDFEFDEDAFKKAQEEEAKKRLERIRETKRGLNDWKGWRVDVVDIRVGMGGVFEI